MTNTPTAHNSAKASDFAKTVLMPGDPLRAKYIAETYLENARQVTAVRNMFGYTGTYKGKEISVMGGGMGMPSIGIYSYELFNFYDVDQIIRIGSAGALQDHMKLMDVVIGMGACTDSNYAYQYGLPGTFAPIADYELLKKAKMDIPPVVELGMRLEKQQIGLEGPVLQEQEMIEKIVKLYRSKCGGKKDAAR